MIRLFIAFMMFVSAPVLAADFGLEAGFRSQTADGVKGSSNEAKTNYQLGAVGQFEFSGPWRLRSGLLYTVRSVEFSANQVNTTATLTYFDVPVQVMYKFEDYGGVFFGPIMSLNLEKKCEITGVTNCALDDVQTPIVPLQLGGTFKFMPQFGATLYYETISGSVAKNIDNSRAVGINLLFTFD